MQFDTDIFAQFDKKWALLTAGGKEKFNTMTISWGGLGTLWGKPVATVYVRESRYTHEFMDREDYFTVSFYPESCRRTLGVLASVLGPFAGTCHFFFLIPPGFVILKLRSGRSRITSSGTVPSSKMAVQKFFDYYRRISTTSPINMSWSDCPS